MKETALIDIHKALNARFSDFGGYKMPLWYDSAKKEHLAVIHDVGIFDTSHMSLLTIRGDGAKELFKQSYSRSISGLKSGRALYGLFLYGDDYVLDDAILYKRDDSTFHLVVNAGMSKKVIDHLNSFDIDSVEITDYTDRLTKLDIQGPNSLELVERLFSRDFFNDFPYFSFKGDFKDGGVLISRSGYTGEFGFELYILNSRGGELWKRVIDTGKDLGITPCGLAARDSLRVGAGLPLSHQDIGAWPFVNTPWNIALDREITRSETYTYMYVGFDVRKLSESEGDVILGDNSIGSVLTCVTEVSLTRDGNKILSVTSKELPPHSKVKGLVAGFIKVYHPLTDGDIVELRDNRRSLKVEIVNDIRPDRTARVSITNMRIRYKKRSLNE